MLYDIAHFWVALLIAVMLGIGVGWFTRSDEPRHGPILRLGSGWIFWSGVLFTAGLVLALVHLIPDRPGLWLETALLLFVAYLVGCPIAGWLPAASVVRGKPIAISPNVTPVRPAPASDELAVSSRSVGGADDSVHGDRVRATMPSRVATSTTSDEAETRPVTSFNGSEARRDGIAERDDRTSKAIDADGRTSRTTGIISDDPDAVDQPKSSA